jgi:RNA polymerase sigma-70 factor (ECF subfamily)
MDESRQIATRLSLLERLRCIEDQRSWQEFFDTYSRLIHNVARKAGLNADEAWDVVQDTVVSTARHMEGFRYDPSRGSFKTWLLNMTRWRITDRIRRRHATGPSVTLVSWAQAGLPEDADVVDPMGPPLERLWDEEWAANLMEIATQRLKAQVSARQFQIFYLHVLREIPVREVARQLGVSIGAVYLAKHRVGRSWRRQLEILRAAES